MVGYVCQRPINGGFLEFLAKPRPRIISGEKSELNSDRRGDRGQKQGVGESFSHISEGVAMARVGVLLFLISFSAAAQQVNDPNFRFENPNPAFAQGKGPTV